MVFMSPSYVIVIKAIYIIVSVFVIPILRGDVVNGINCCTDPDIRDLTVECVDGLAMLTWNSQEGEYSTHFVVNYGCNSNASCSGGEKTRTFRRYQHAGNITDSDIGNSTCWFRMNKYTNENCGTIAICNPDSNTITSSSMSISEPSVSSSPSTLSTSSLSSSVMSSVSIFSSLSSYPSSTDVLPTATTTVYTATPTINTVTIHDTTTTTVITATIMATPASTVTNATETFSILVLTNTASIHPSPSVASFENTSQDIYSLLLYITVCCAVIIILLLVSVCLFAYWRKRKRQQLENYQIEDVCCEDPGELAKESDSETETLANGNGMGDDISITEDDMYMLRKILRLDILSLDPSIFTDNEADDGSVASHYRTDDGGVECSHYCGSGGHCLQSNASSSQHRSSSCSSVF